ncbi:reverse transcriptase domain-containing protein [Tanacetum coccineum]|uniref:Reverse transcriptase domain-containing protein n=1 Tax=Tanacetum coccineum TaxID=301880 RepID=A0ABQ5J2D4_9ASTR
MKPPQRPFPFTVHGTKMLERLAGNEYYVSTMVSPVLSKFPIETRDQEKTTFTCHTGTFASVAWLRLMQCSRHVSRCYVSNFHDMVEKTMAVFNGRLLKAILWSKRALSSAIRFLRKGLRLTKPKSMSLQNYLIPPPSKELGSFRGHAVFTGCFIQDFSKIIRPMTISMRRILHYLSDDCIRAFQTLKDRLTEAPILIAPNWDLPFELMCDASDFAIGAVLGQRHEKTLSAYHYASRPD